MVAERPLPRGAGADGRSEPPARGNLPGTAPTLRTQKKALDAAEAEFERLVENGDDSAVMEQVLNVEAARAELNKTRTLMLLRMRRVLTTDQWVKLGAMHQADERERKQSQHQSDERKQSPQRGSGK